MTSELKRVESYDVILKKDKNKVVKYQEYKLFDGGIHYKIFVKDSKIEILKEGEDKLYQRLLEEEVGELLKAIEQNIKIFEEDDVFTGAPEISGYATISNFDEGDDESYERAKELVKHKEK